MKVYLAISSCYVTVSRRTVNFNIFIINIIIDDESNEIRNILEVLSQRIVMKYDV